MNKYIRDRLLSMRARLLADNLDFRNFETRKDVEDWASQLADKLAGCVSIIEDCNREIMMWRVATIIVSLALVFVSGAWLFFF